MPNIMVTGGSGFIGAHLVDALHAAGHRVTNFDTARPAKSDHMPFWFAGDILSKEDLRKAFDTGQPEIVLHLAARAEIQSKTASAFISITEGTRNLLDAIDGSGTVRRLINTSTQLVVGPGHYPTSETEFQPYTIYGECKALAERELRERNPQVEWTIVRPTNIWGPFHPSFATAIWLYIKKRYYLHPSGPPIIRCYGYVENTVRQYIALMNAPARAVHQRVFYLSDGEIDSARWLDEFSLQLCGFPVRRAPRPLLRMIAFAGDLFSATGHSAPIDSQRLMRMSTEYRVPLDSMFALSGPPLVPLDEGVKRTVEWLRSAFPERYRT